MIRVYRCRMLALLLAITLLALCSCLELPGSILRPETPISPVVQVEEGLEYLEAADVALYLHSFGSLPPNYLTKREAEQLGWIASKGNLWDVAPGSAIGGDRFGNREGLLPAKTGRLYFECDVAYTGGYRGPERLVYSSDGLIYYTADHYETFELLYGEVDH